MRNEKATRIGEQTPLNPPIERGETGCRRRGGVSDPPGVRVIPFVCERNPSPIVEGILFSEDGKQNDTFLR
jgi:hypothetical protein